MVVTDIIVFLDELGEFQNFVGWFKVEKILKGGLDLIPSPSPSVKIQIMAGKFTSVKKAKHCWVMSTNFLFSKLC